MAVYSEDLSVLASAGFSSTASVRMNTLELTLAANATSTPTPSEVNRIDLPTIGASAALTPSSITRHAPTLATFAGTGQIIVTSATGLRLDLALDAAADLIIDAPSERAASDFDLLAAASLNIDFVLDNPDTLTLLAFASLTLDETAQGHAVELLLEATASITAEPGQCNHLPLENDAGDLLIIGTGRCPSCRPQPFFPRLFADSERRSIRVPVTNNLIESIVVAQGRLALLVNDFEEPLIIVTTGLVLSKHDAPQFGHYLGWTLKGEDPPFKVETVEMEFANTRVWDAP